MGGRIKILSIGDMDPRVDTALAARFEVVRDDSPGFDKVTAENGHEFPALITRGQVPTTAALMDRLPKLELIGHFGVGYDSVDVEAAARRGVVVINTPDVLNDEMGDFTIGLLLATIRRIPQADRYIRDHKWPNENFPLGDSLRNRRIGIAGMGRIGKTIARRLAGFDLPIATYVRRPRPDLAGYQLHETMLELAQAVDTLIVVLPGGAATRHAVDAAVLRALGPNGVLINVARGSVVDEQALIGALRDGTILAAGLDVFADEPHVPDELKRMDQVVLQPHIGTATLHTRGLMGRLVVDNVNAWFDGKGALTPVPETPQQKRRAK